MWVAMSTTIVNNNWLDFTTFVVSIKPLVLLIFRVVSMNETKYRNNRLCKDLHTFSLKHFYNMSGTDKTQPIKKIKRGRKGVVLVHSLHYSAKSQKYKSSKRVWQLTIIGLNYFILLGRSFIFDMRQLSPAAINRHFPVNYLLLRIQVFLLCWFDPSTLFRYMFTFQIRVRIHFLRINVTTFLTDTKRVSRERRLVENY